MTEKIIMGRINSSNTVGFWKAGDGCTPDVFVGDYAIVENMNDYDLIKIIAILETSEKYEKFIVPNGITKSVVRYMARCLIRKDY